MCGIVGYVGNKDAIPFLISGLKRLEYRGYDSAGIATLNGGNITVIKAEGKINNLVPLTKTCSGKIGIGHTRWATHGAAKQKNAHPHLSKNGTFAIVHNGIIENCDRLKDFLVERGFTFNSDTDSETIAHLLEYYYDGSVFDAITKAASVLIGSFAIGVLCKHEQKLYAIKKDSPLVVGLSIESNYISSDMQTLLNNTHDFYILDNNEIAVIDDRVTVFDLNGKQIKKSVYHAKNEVKTAEKDGFSYFMLKEIYEQPRAISDTLAELKRKPLPFSTDINDIHIVGCGSAYHAALMGKYFIESICDCRVTADIASEFRYRNPILRPNDLLLAISQSGETADTIGALNLGVGKCNTACIVNVPESTLTRVATPIYTKAGPEVAVATTKGFITQLVNLYAIAAFLLKSKHDERFIELKSEIQNLPTYVTQTLKVGALTQRLGQIIAPHDYAFFIGRGADYAAAKESALKLKEISYIHADCYPAGELKHGTISLIEKGSIVVAIATDEALLDKTVSNIVEVKARGAFVIGISCFDISSVCDEVVRIPKTKFVSPLLATIASQLLAFYTALLRGCDIDKPRNLAKSVTVE
ncbi:MAG: glutamine--fructose-6-phosphate transaminase (isomerizing) [Clostridia bacterium]|nr:glutamine--fructose-6-phosphate transaminase (isomerizing) [Clostridia bacterium]